MSGCGDPYHVESVPHTMRSGPSATSSLPSTCAASTGRRSMRNHVLPSSAYTLPSGPMPASSRLLINRSTPRVAFARVVRSFLAVGIALVARVVHDELDVGERGRGRADVARRCRGQRLLGDRPAETLVRRDDARPERVDAFEERDADLVVVEEPAAGRRGLRRRPVERVALPPRRRRRARHSSIASSSCGPRFGCTIVCVSTRPDPGVAVDDVARGRDLRVGEHVRRRRARVSR